MKGRLRKGLVGPISINSWVTISGTNASNEQIKDRRMVHHVLIVAQQ